MRKVVVTGYEVLSAIGNNAKENLESLRAGRPGIRTPKYLDSRYAQTHKFGEIQLSNDELYQLLLEDRTKNYNRTELLSFLCAERAVENSGISTKSLTSSRTCLISSTTVGGMCNMNEIHSDSNKLGSPSPYLDSYSPGLHTRKLATRLGVKGRVATINTACSSSANAIALGSRLIKSGRADRAIVGGVDSLSKFTINGFDSLQILFTDPCRPFDALREGLNLGEGVAYLVLEAEDVVDDKKVYCEVAGYGNANDAHHPSALSDEAVGVLLSMKEALKVADVEPEHIDYINAHGTATLNNDQTELTGLTKLFNKVPRFNSTKSYTGHTLAAAGAVEAVFSIFSMEHGEVYKSLNFENPIETFNLVPQIRHEEGLEINTVLSNSFGFAGNCSSLVLKRYQNVC